MTLRGVLNLEDLFKLSDECDEYEKKMYLNPLMDQNGDIINIGDSVKILRNPNKGVIATYKEKGFYEDASGKRYKASSLIDSWHDDFRQKVVKVN